MRRAALQARPQGSPRASSRARAPLRAPNGPLLGPGEGAVRAAKRVEPRSNAGLPRAGIKQRSCRAPFAILKNAYKNAKLSVHRLVLSNWTARSRVNHRLR